ncbi:hypothetical protein FSHL1_012783 [Fusarium sambucinum]
MWSRNTATALLPSNYRVTFLDWVKGHAGYSNDVWHDDDDEAWINCMQQRGIATELQQAIMDPDFKYMRMTGTCLTWLRDTIKMRYAALEEIQRQRAIQRANSRPCGSGLPEDLAGQRSISDMTIGSCSSASALAALDAPGMTVLFKAVDSARNTRLLDAQGKLSNAMELASTTPSDFSRNMAMLYFTTSFAVAKRHAAWIKRRAKSELVVVIIRIAIRNSVIERMPEGKVQHLYWPGADWKEFFWRCRTRKRSTPSLRKYADATLVIGTMANKPNSYYHNFESGSQLTEASVLKVDGQYAIQFAFSTDEEGEDLILEAAPILQMFLFTPTDMQVWIRGRQQAENLES